MAMDNLTMTINEISAEWERAPALNVLPLDGILAIAESPLSATESQLSDAQTLSLPLPVAVHSHAEFFVGGNVKVEESDSNSSVFVSTAFFPGSNIKNLPTNLILHSSDSVFFYVNSERLLASSNNTFNSLLLPELLESGHAGMSPILNVSETSSVVNIILHAIHDMSCSQYGPSLPDLMSAVAALQKYGVLISNALAPSAPLYSTVLSYAPTQPLEVYCFAAENNLYDLAAATSSHLLSFQLPKLTDEAVGRIGGVYLKKLFFLHLGRVDALKRIIITPPQLHAPTHQCDFGDQRRLTRAWGLATASVTWEGRPDISASMIESMIRPLMNELSCETCRTSMNERIHEVVVQWSLVKVNSRYSFPTRRKLFKGS